MIKGTAPEGNVYLYSYITLPLDAGQHHQANKPGGVSPDVASEPTQLLSTDACVGNTPPSFYGCWVRRSSKLVLPDADCPTVDSCLVKNAPLTWRPTCKWMCSLLLTCSTWSGNLYQTSPIEFSSPDEFCFGPTIAKGWNLLNRCKHIGD